MLITRASINASEFELSVMRDYIAISLFRSRLGMCRGYSACV